MKKDKILPENKWEENSIEEPAFNYQKSNSLNPPCQYSVEKLRERFDLAVKQVENGEYFTEDELDDFIFS